MPRHSTQDIAIAAHAISSYIVGAPTNFDKALAWARQHPTHLSRLRLRVGSTGIDEVVAVLNGRNPAPWADMSYPPARRAVQGHRRLARTMLRAAGYNV